MYPLGRTELFLHQNHYKLLKQDYGGLYHLCTDKQKMQRNYAVERFIYEVILNRSRILCYSFQSCLWKMLQAPSSYGRGQASIVFWISFRKKKICTCSMSNEHSSSKDSELLLNHFKVSRVSLPLFFIIQIKSL